MRRNLVKEGTVLFADLYLKVEHCVWWGQGVAQADSSEKSLPRALRKQFLVVFGLGTARYGRKVYEV